MDIVAIVTAALTLAGIVLDIISKSWKRFSPKWMKFQRRMNLLSTWLARFRSSAAPWLSDSERKKLQKYKPYLEGLLRQLEDPKSEDAADGISAN